MAADQPGVPATVPKPPRRPLTYVQFLVDGLYHKG